MVARLLGASRAGSGARADRLRDACPLRRRFLERSAMWDAWERFKMADVKGWTMGEQRFKATTRWLPPESRFDVYSGN